MMWRFKPRPRSHRSTLVQPSARFSHRSAGRGLPRNDTSEPETQPAFDVRVRRGFPSAKDAEAAAIAKEARDARHRDFRVFAPKKDGRPKTIMENMKTSEIKVSKQKQKKTESRFERERQFVAKPKSLPFSCFLPPT